MIESQRNLDPHNEVDAKYAALRTASLKILTLIGVMSDDIAKEREISEASIKKVMSGLQELQLQTVNLPEVNRTLKEHTNQVQALLVKHTALHGKHDGLDDKLKALDATINRVLVELDVIKTSGTSTLRKHTAAEHDSDKRMHSLELRVVVLESWKIKTVDPKIELVKKIVYGFGGIQLLTLLVLTILKLLK